MLQQVFKILLLNYKFLADILDEFESDLRKLKIKEVQVECMGGGRILNEANKKEILVYGYSMVTEQLFAD